MLDETTDRPRSALLSHFAFAIILAAVIARCLMLETIREAPGSNDPNAPPGPGAATSIVLDWLSVVPMLLLLLRQALDRAFRLHFTLVHALLAALACWTLASVCWADDRFLALISAARIAGGAALFFATTQIATRAAHLRVIVGVVVGILLVNVVQGALYLNVEMADMRDYWVKHRAEILAQHGWHEGDYTAQRFELKLLAGEMINFSVSTNVLGALAVTAALASLGAALQRFKDKDEPGLTGALLLCAGSGAYILSYTASKASWAALVLGVGLLGAWSLLRERLVIPRRVIFFAGLGVAALALSGVVGYGIASHGLPSASLNFRWRYWVGSWQLFLERPLTGVGWGNFADAYLRHRVPAAAEEIQDPHSFLVRWATELGAIGLGIGVAWLIAWAWAATTSSIANFKPHISNFKSQISNLQSQKALTLTLSRDAGRGDQSARESGTPPMRIVIVVASLLFALALTIFCTIDFAGDGNYAILEIARRSMFIALIAIAVGLVCLGRRESESEPFLVDERPAPFLAAGLFIGVLMMLLQSTIDMAFFQPGPWALMMLMMGTLAGSFAQNSRDATPSPVEPGVLSDISASIEDQRRRGVAATRMTIAACATAAIVWLATGATVVAPLVLAESEAADGDRFVESKPHDMTAYVMYRKAVAFSPVWNADYLTKVATAAIRNEGGLDVRTPLGGAIEVSPQHALNWLTRSRWLASQPKVSTADADQAITDFARAITLNPNDVDLRIEYADLLERFGQRGEAADQLDTALKLDDQLDPAEPERLQFRSPGKRETLRQHAATLRIAPPNHVTRIEPLPELKAK